VASKFPTDCKLCHNSNNWLNATFDHSTTSFPLTGSHVSVECASCHTTGYAGTSSECKSCHQAKYTAAQVPSHTAAGISVECKTCHTTTDWKPSSFNHTTTGFALTGGHASVVQCSSCHKGNTTSASSECISCHQAQYNGAKDHVASKFPTDCRICHNSVNWLQSTFNHSTTKFPLTGAHTTTDCISCHASGYVGTSTSCNSCHLNDYNQATNPNHKTLGLSTTCTDCHTTAPGWQPASFPNHSTYFALTGAHATIAKDCAACHKGVYSNTPKTCYDCHTTDYNNTKNPAHQAAQFSTDCKSCHTSNAWTPSTFNHTNYFPISSGRHAVSCSICHTTPTNYTIFTCVTSSCHTNAHNRSQGSAGCYRCHPTGRGD
jgi:nitrate/TMAO reductase-like tetraheme cytochrome c subunit